MTTTLITADNRIADMLYDAWMSFVHLNLIIYSTLVLDGGQYAPVWRNDRETRKLYLSTDLKFVRKIFKFCSQIPTKTFAPLCLTILLFCKKTIFADISLGEYHYKFILSNRLTMGKNNNG